MIPIFTPWPAVSSAGPQSAGAPICCGADVELRLVAARPEDVTDAGERAETAHRSRGEREREAVRDEPVAPADRRASGTLRRELAAERALLGARSARRAPGARASGGDSSSDDDLRASAAAPAAWTGARSEQRRRAARDGE